MNDRKLLKYCEEFRKGLLGNRSSSLMCIAVSSALQGFLSFCEIETKLINGGIKGIFINHAWLELPDGRIIDATADQFNDGKYNMPEVYIGERPDNYIDYVWQPSHEC